VFRLFPVVPIYREALRSFWSHETSPGTVACPALQLSTRLLAYPRNPDNIAMLTPCLGTAKQIPKVSDDLHD
jgi:hypothetical protein